MNNIDLKDLNEKVHSFFFLLKGMTFYKFKYNKELYHIHIIFCILRKIIPVLGLIILSILFSELHLNEKFIFCPKTLYDNIDYLKYNCLSRSRKNIIKNLIKFHISDTKSLLEQVDKKCKDLKVNHRTKTILLKMIEEICFQNYYHQCKDPALMVDNVLLKCMEYNYDLDLFDTYNLFDPDNKRSGYFLRNGYSLISFSIRYLTRSFNKFWIRVICFSYTFLVLYLGYELVKNIFIMVSLSFFNFWNLLSFLKFLIFFFFYLVFFRGDFLHPIATFWNLLRVTDFLSIEKIKEHMKIEELKDFKRNKKLIFLTPKYWITSNLKNRICTIIENGFSGDNWYIKTITTIREEGVFSKGFFKIKRISNLNDPKFQPTYISVILLSMGGIMNICSNNLSNQLNILDQYLRAQNTYYCLKQWVPRGITKTEYSLSLVFSNNLYEKCVSIPAYFILSLVNYNPSFTLTLFNPLTLTTQFIIVSMCTSSNFNEEKVSKSCYKNTFYFMFLYVFLIPFILNFRSFSDYNTKLIVKFFYFEKIYNYKGFNLKAFIYEHLFIYINYISECTIEPDISVEDPLTTLYYM